MARDQDDWRSKRDKEDEKEHEFEEAARRKGIQNVKTGSLPPGSDELKNADPTSEKTRDLLTRLGPMIEQLDHLYNMYFSGAEKRPPIEKRKQVDELVVALQNFPKATPTLQFQYNNLIARYATYREKWEKKLTSR